MQENDKAVPAYYISGSDTMGYAVIDGHAGMPLCAPRSTMAEALRVVVQYDLPLSPLMWDSDTLGWVSLLNIEVDDE